MCVCVCVRGCGAHERPPEVPNRKRHKAVDLPPEYEEGSRCCGDGTRGTGRGARGSTPGNL